MRQYKDQQTPVEPDNQVQRSSLSRAVKEYFLSEIKKWASIEGNWECHIVTEEFSSMIILEALKEM